MIVSSCFAAFAEEKKTPSSFPQNNKTMKSHATIIKILPILALLATGCASSKDILYFQDIDRTAIENLTTAYEAVIKKDDRLSIVVSGPDKSVIAPYNLTISENLTGNMDPERGMLSYLVDSHGNIDFPIIGTIHVEGMTRNQLVEYLTIEIGKDVKSPVVSVTFKNYKISVLGEVRNPGTYTVDSEKINILQALSLAGDLNLTAKRNGILLLREENGRIVYHTIDLRKSNLLNSPYFFLQQNDILYIPPSSGRVATATNSVSVWTTMVTSLTSTLALIVTVLSLVK